MIRYKYIKDIPTDKTNNFTVFYMGSERYFQVFESPIEFIKFYRSVPKSLRHYYEVIRKDNRKLIVDIDKDVSLDEIVNFCIDLENTTGGKAIIFSSCSEQKVSYHIIVRGPIFTIEESKNIIDKIDHDNICDMSIYKINQMFRLEGSTKYQETRYKYLLNRNELSDNPEKYFAFVNIEESINTHKVIKYKAPDIVVDGFTIRRQESPTLILLKRVYPSHCDICNRIHDNENAYLIKKYNNNWEFHCFRSPERGKMLFSSSAKFPISLF